MHQVSAANPPPHPYPSCIMFEHHVS
jgi:hypothetical protein